MFLMNQYRYLYGKITGMTHRVEAFDMYTIFWVFFRVNEKNFWKSTQRDGRSRAHGTSFMRNIQQRRQGSICHSRNITKDIINKTTNYDEWTV